MKMVIQKPEYCLKCPLLATDWKKGILVCKLLGKGVGTYFVNKERRQDCPFDSKRRRENDK